MYDATEIFRTLDGHKKEVFIKLGFYLISFFYYLYRYVIYLPWYRNFGLFLAVWLLLLSRRANDGCIYNVITIWKSFTHSCGFHWSRSAMSLRPSLGLGCHLLTTGMWDPGFWEYSMLGSGLWNRDGSYITSAVRYFTGLLYASSRSCGHASHLPRVRRQHVRGLGWRTIRFAVSTFTSTSSLSWVSLSLRHDSPPLL